MTVPATGSRAVYPIRVSAWRQARDAGLRIPWALAWLSIVVGVLTLLLEKQLPSWIWYPVAIPLIGSGIAYGLLRKRLQSLAEQLGLICWNCGNIAVESANYRLIENPETVVREGRCLSCFRKVDEPER